MKVYVVNILAIYQVPIAVYSDFEVARKRCREFLESKYPNDTFVEKHPGYFSRADDDPGELWHGYIAGLELDQVVIEQVEATENH